MGCTPVLPLCAERSGAALAMARLQQRQALVSSSACPSVCTSAAAVEGGPAVGMASSFLGEKVRMTAVSTVAGVRAAGKMVPTTTTTATTLPVVRAVQRDGGVMQGDNKPWVAPRARIFPGAESATETSAVATDYATVPGGRSNLFGFSPSQGRVDSDEDSDEDGEVLRVDNESIDDEDQLGISNLGIPPGVVESLAKRGITQLFPIQVCAALRQPIHVLLDFGPRPFAASLCKC